MAGWVKPSAGWRCAGGRGAWRRGWLVVDNGGMDTVRGVVALAFIAAHTVVWCAPLYLLGAVKLLMPTGALRRALGAPMDRIIDGWVASNRAMIRVLRLTRARIECVDGAPLSRASWYLVVSNHQSWVDILVLQDAFLGRVPPLKFFTKRVLVWAPLVGIAMWLLGFPYVYRYGREKLAANPALAERDRQATLNAAAGFKERPTAVLSFLEGTRFTAAKHQAQGSPFTRLLRPKAGGLGYVGDALGERLAGVVDVTIQYPAAPPSFWDFLCGRCPKVDVRIENLGVPTALTGNDRAALKDWVDALWLAKDRRLVANDAPEGTSAAAAPPA